MVACSFYLLSLIMTGKYLEDQDIKYFILSQVLLFGALLSKEISITLPLAQAWMIWHYKHESSQHISSRLLFIRYIAYSALVVVLFLSYRLFIFGQNPFTIDSIYNIGGFYHFFINAVKIVSFLVVPFGHQSFEMLVYDYKLYLIVVLIPIVIRVIMIIYQHRKELLNDIMLSSLILISVLPLFKLAMRWYMYIPAVFFSIFLAHITYSMWNRGDISRALVSIYLSLNIYGGLSSYKIWLDNSRLNRVLVTKLVDKIEKETTADMFVILNFPAKINRTATFVAGFEELIHLKVSDKDKTVLRPVNIVHQSSMFPTDINQQGDNIVINACEASSYCLVGTNRQRFGLEKLAAGDSIKTSVADIHIEKVNETGQAVRVTLSMHPWFEKNSTLYLYFNESKNDYEEYVF